MRVTIEKHIEMLDLMPVSLRKGLNDAGAVTWNGWTTRKFEVFDANGSDKEMIETYAQRLGDNYL